MEMNVNDSFKPVSRPAAWYALRRTLPLWSFEENLRELIDYLPRYGVDELIVKVDTEEFSHGQVPLKWLEAYVPHLHRIREEMNKLGIVYSLNPWITFGHADRGRDGSAVIPGLQTCVGHDGAECTCCACPLCPQWRDHTARLWTLYAQTKPHVLWVEDDIRTFNHAPVLLGCFCPKHLQHFGRLVNAEVSREELVKAIYRPGEPHPWRKAFLDMQGRIMVDVVAQLARTVHKTSPATCMGLMSSGPRTHCMEGRRWNEFATALADGQPLYSRPPMGNYNEDSPRGFYYSHDSIKLTRHCLPKGAIDQTEVESWPFTLYSKSIKFTFVEMAISFAFGSAGLTMNLFDHAGTPMEMEPQMGQMLGRVKPYLNALAGRSQLPGTYRGVRMLYDSRESYFKRMIPNAWYEDLAADGHGMMCALESHGIPTTYDESAVTCATGQTIRALDDSAIRQLLSGGKGLFLDGMAAAVLAERGFSDLIGLKQIDPPRSMDLWPDKPFSAEEFFNPDFGGADKMFLTLTLPSLGVHRVAARLRPRDEAQIVSKIVDPDGRRHDVFSYAYENQLGGRVFVHALDMKASYGISYHHPFRATQLHHAVNWLARGEAPFLVRGDGVYPLAFRKDCQEGVLLGLFNLSLDPWPAVEFSVGDVRPIGQFERLTPQGEWIHDPAIKITTGKTGAVTVQVNQAIPFEQPLFLWGKWQA
jgi:hypothetical protein